MNKYRFPKTYKIYQEIKNISILEKLLLFSKLKDDIFKGEKVELSTLIEESKEHIIIKNSQNNLCYFEKATPYIENIASIYPNEPEKEIFIKNNLGDGDLVHAGAGYGENLIQYSKFINQNQIIWAFEPIPDNFKCCQINLLLNDVGENVILKNLGLTDECSDKNFRIINKKTNFKLGIGTSIVKGKNEYTESFFCSTIDTEIPKYRKISIINLVVEYHEQYTLDGGLETIKRNLPIIIVRTSPKEKWLKENLFPLGYKNIGKVDQNTVFSCGGIDELV